MVLYPKISCTKSWLISRLQVEGWQHCMVMKLQGKSEVFDSCDWPSYLVDLAIGCITLKHNIEFISFILCSWFHSKLWIKAGVIVLKHWRQSWIGVFGPCEFENCTNDPKKNRTPFLCPPKRCASFHSYVWIEAIVIMEKNHKIWVKFALISVILNFDPWSRSFPWTLLLSMAIGYNISWWYQERNITKRCDRQGHAHGALAFIQLLCRS